MPPTFLLADPALAVVRTHVHALPRRQARAARGGLKAGWIVLATIAVAIAGGLGFLGTWPPLATVMSASMSPTIDTGDMVVLRRLGAPAQVGDVVSIPFPPTRAAATAIRPSSSTASRPSRRTAR